MKIGVSGHQNLGSTERTAWVRNRIISQLTTKRFSVGVSSLAAGADQLFAEVVLELGKHLEVVIPCHGYEASFKKTQFAKQFRSLKQKASECYLLNFQAPSEEAFYQAGCRIVDMSDFMLFVWNGKPSKGIGGTADIVAYAEQANRPYVRINPSEAPMSLAS